MFSTLFFKKYFFMGRIVSPEICQRKTSSTVTLGQINARFMKIFYTDKDGRWSGPLLELPQIDPETHVVQAIKTKSIHTFS